MLRKVIFGVAALWAASYLTSCSAWDDYDVISIDKFNDTTDLMDFQVKYKRINRTTFGLTGSVELHDLTTIESEMLIWHQAKGGQPFVLTPYKLPRGSICQSLNQDYRKFLMMDLHMYSDLPFSEDQMEDLCPQFQNKKFEIKDFMLTETTIPESMEMGTYKVEGKMYKDDCFYQGVCFIIKLY